MDVVQNYIIVDVDCVVTTYHAENVKEAICKYAENCGLKIALTIFEKAVQNLELIEIIDLFNQNCLGDSDKIERIYCPTYGVVFLDRSTNNCGNCGQALK